MSPSIKIRPATLSDLDTLEQIERACFPIAEAASKAQIERRILTFPEHFLVLENDGEPIGMINGAIVEEKDLLDAMYEDPAFHTETGAHQMIFGLDVLPAWQHRGYAKILMNALIEQASLEGREDLVLTCKERLIPFYEQFGFENEGLSASQHGNVAWYQMRKRLT